MTRSSTQGKGDFSTNFDEWQPHRWGMELTPPCIIALLLRAHSSSAYREGQGRLPADHISLQPRQGRWMAKCIGHDRHSLVSTTRESHQKSPRVGRELQWVPCCVPDCHIRGLLWVTLPSLLAECQAVCQGFSRCAYGTEAARNRLSPSSTTSYDPLPAFIAIPLLIRTTTAGARLRLMGIAIAKALSVPLRSGLKIDLRAEE